MSLNRIQQNLRKSYLKPRFEEITIDGDSKIGNIASDNGIVIKSNNDPQLEIKNSANNLSYFKSGINNFACGGGNYGAHVNQFAFRGSANANEAIAIGLNANVTDIAGVAIGTNINQSGTRGCTIAPFNTTTVTNDQSNILLKSNEIMFVGNNLDPAILPYSGVAQTGGNYCIKNGKASAIPVSSSAVSPIIQINVPENSYVIGYFDIAEMLDDGSSANFFSKHGIFSRVGAGNITTIDTTTLNTVAPPAGGFTAMTTNFNTTPATGVLSVNVTNSNIGVASCMITARYMIYQFA